MTCGRRDAGPCRGAACCDLDQEGSRNIRGSLCFIGIGQHLQLVLEALEQNELYVGLSKCAFGLQEVGFLGHVVSANGIKPDPAKVTAVAEWPTPKSLKEVRSFLGLTGYYRRFIRHYSDKALPLTELTRADTPWCWGPAQQTAFDALKSALVSAPVLVMPDPTLPFEVFTDASQFALGAVLLQNKHPCGFLVTQAYSHRAQLPHWRP